MKTTSDKEVFEKIDTSVNQMDALRKSGLTDFEENQMVKNEILIRESKRLSEKYGPTHPRVVALNTRNANYDNMSIGLESEKEKAAIKSGHFEGTSWQLHGKVFDEKLQPMEGLTVYLSDEKKEWIEKLDSFCTDKTGYFALTLTEELIDRLKGISIFTSVSNKSKKVLYLAKNPAVITKGKIDYIEILIKENDCIDPPTKRDKNPTEPRTVNVKATEPLMDSPTTKPVGPSDDNLTKGDKTRPVRSVIGNKEGTKEQKENKKFRPK